MLKSLLSVLALVALASPVAADLRPMPRDSGARAPSSPILQAKTPPRRAFEVVERQAQSGGFETWRNRFKSRAVGKGIRPAVFDAAFAGVRPSADVLRLDRSQAEFTKTIWEYLDTAVSDTRITNGRQNYRRLKRTVEAIEARYGVEASVVVAVWGMETNYGGFRGSTDTIQALATLAYDGRRRAWAEEQLIGALKILQSGDVRPRDMRGSWAGAMGHTQFIPTSYLAYAQDFTGDGRRDVWGTDPTDALASTANYLARHGWVKGQPWGVEVVVPRGFDYGLADAKTKRSIGQWTRAGLRRPDGSAVPNYGEAALFAPAGARGPMFLTFKNFQVIKRYNNANSYAMGVGHLADRINGRPDFAIPWPRGDRALSRREKAELQRLLTARGFDTKGADGKVGPNTIAAIRRYQRAAGLVPDGYASADLLQRLR
ncbi:MAG: lytic murein transglycosylase [Pseudomonadota bacterium]